MSTLSLPSHRRTDPPTQSTELAERPMTMNRNDRLDTQDAEGKKTPSQGSLLLQFALIGSGRVGNTTEEMQEASAAMVEEVIDAAIRAGLPAKDFPGNALPLSVSTVYSLFDWLDAVCSAAGPDTVAEIFARPKPQYLQ
jgi:hypothetical protein